MAWDRASQSPGALAMSISPAATTIRVPFSPTRWNCSTPDPGVVRGCWSKSCRCSSMTTSEALLQPTSNLPRPDAEGHRDHPVESHERYLWDRHLIASSDPGEPEAPTPRGVANGSFLAPCF